MLQSSPGPRAGQSAAATVSALIHPAADRFHLLQQQQQPENNLLLLLDFSLSRHTFCGNLFTPPTLHPLQPQMEIKEDQSLIYLSVTAKPSWTESWIVLPQNLSLPLRWILLSTFSRRTPAPPHLPTIPTIPSSPSN